MNKVHKITAAAIFFSFIFCSCLPSPPATSSNSRTITVYGFSILKEPLENDIFPAFAEKWKSEHGVEVNFVSSFAGSETVTNQILQGTPADIAILSIERDAQRLVAGGAANENWRDLPHHGIINKTPFIILVRAGNPKHITDFSDLAKPGIKVIHPDPVSSGGAQWSILSIYGAELLRSEEETGRRDPERATQMLRAIWKNVIATPGSAREARTNFETGYGDALITYELEGLSMKIAGSPVDIVYPSATIFSEHPALIVERNVDAESMPLVKAFLEYLWTDEAQKAFVKHHFRSVTNEKFNDENPEFGAIKHPFTIEMFGGWERAYPEVIENVFLKQVQNK